MDIKSATTRLLVSDLEACFLFYRDVMEFKVNIEALEEGYVEFQTAEMKFALFRRLEMAEIVGTASKPHQVDCQDGMVLIFTVPDLDTAYQQLRNKGVKFSTEPMNNPYYGIKTAYLRDPDGTLIGLFQTLV